MLLKFHSFSLAAESELLSTRASPSFSQSINEPPVYFMLGIRIPVRFSLVHKYLELLQIIVIH